MSTPSALSVKRGQPRRSRFVSGLLLVLSLGLVMGSGYLFGRYVIGEGYLRQTLAPAAVAVRQTMPSPPETPRPQVALPPLTEEPSSSRTEPNLFDEESAPSPRSRPPSPASVEPSSEAPLEEPQAEELRQREFSVQVGVFLRQESAETLADELRENDQPARVVNDSRDGASTYRVLCGRYRGEAEARRAAGALKDAGYEAFVVSYP